MTDSQSPDPTTTSALLVSEAGSTRFSNAVSISSVQLLNAVSDDPALAVELVETATGTPLLTGDLAFSGLSGFVDAAPGFLTVTVSPDGGGTRTNTTVSIDEDAFYTVVVGGRALDDTIVSRVNRAEYRRAATQGAIEFVNGLTATDDEDVSAVDFYALEVGDSLADVAPVFANVDFLDSATGFLPATTLDLVVTTAGSESILAGPVRYLVPDGEADSIAVLEASGGGQPNQIVITPVALP